MAEQRNREGQRLGNYRLERLLGRGGFAEVYLGEHLRLHTLAAVKVLSTRLASHNEVESFEKEAQIIAHLRHPHIVRVLDYDVEENTPFLVMDYAPGGTLRKRHPKGTILPLPTIISYVKQVADALQYAHDQHIIHRDVKPENMLVGEHEELLLSDFGIALVAQSSRYQSAQNLGGTMAYMAPEQIQGHPRPASDQYSLGIVVYEWLSGDRPFHGSMTEIVAQHLAVPPPPLREKVPTLTPAVEEVVLTVLAKDPHQRFLSVQAFATALEQASQALRPAFVPPQPVSPPPAPQKPAKPPPLPPTPYVSGPPPQEEVKIPADMPLASATPPPVTESIQTPVPSPAPSPTRTPRKVSRRTVLVGLAVGGALVTGGGITWWFLTPHTPHPLYTYYGHSSSVYAVAWSPDGKRIASGSSDNTVQVWDAIDGGHVFTYRGHSLEVHAVAWSPDGKRIASAGDYGTVQVWDAITGNKIFTYDGYSPVAWSPDGKRIASAGGSGAVQVWDAKW